jgi:lipid II:glycine glycyltransferase (peptidoglycan interpeptide bridge formation enzyme)
MVKMEISSDLRQSQEYAQYIKSNGWQVIRVDNTNIFLRNFLGLKIAKIQRTQTNLPWAKIFPILKKEKVFSLRYEPETISQKVKSTPIFLKNINFPPLTIRGGTKGGDTKGVPGFQFSNWPLLGTKTLRVNLRPAKKNILKSFKKDCRYVLRRFKIQDSRFKKNDFNTFYHIWSHEAKRKKLWIPSNREYSNLIQIFKNKSFCLTYQDLAGLVILIHQKTAYYYYSACRPEGKQLQLPYLLVWAAMQKAKKLGCTVWDFEGIYDDRWPNHGWEGFTHFKKSFGGEEIAFPGSFQKYLWPF